MKRYNPQKLLQQDPTKSMLDVIARFHSFYTLKRRVPLHILMWFLYALIIEFGLIINYNLSLYNSIFFLMRSLIGNSIVFYFFFYFILPRFILKRRELIAGLLTIGCLYLWEINSYLSMVLANRFATIPSLGLREQISEEVNQGFFYIFHIKTFLGNLVYILYSLSPAFCIKIVIDTLKSAFVATESEKDKTTLEINFLKSQLNPHFLFNTLNSIYILNMKKDNTASNVILELSDTLRYTLYESNYEMVPLKKELEFLQNYVSLEKVRQNKNTKIEFNYNEDTIGDLQIAPLLMFPFIENAFKHGLGTSLKDDAYLEINTKVINGIFYFNIKNSKNDENNSKQIKDYPGGIGVSNSKKRLSLLYRNKHFLEIENTPDFYNINLKIDLNYE